MKLKKPDDSIPYELLEKNLMAAIDDARTAEIDIEDKKIYGICLEKSDLAATTFYRVTFDNCQLIQCTFEKASFIDVIFKNCDFSNSNFSEGYFNRCEFISCKFVGANLQDSNQQHISILECNFHYANFQNTSFSHVHIKDSDMSQANISECKLKSWSLDNTRFANTQFFKTPLKGIDFSHSEIDGIILSDQFVELQGAKVNTVQAVNLAKLLGVIVK